MHNLFWHHEGCCERIDGKLTEINISRLVVCKCCGLVKSLEEMLLTSIASEYNIAIKIEDNMLVDGINCADSEFYNNNCISFDVMSFRWPDKFIEDETSAKS